MIGPGGFVCLGHGVSNSTEEITNGLYNNAGRGRPSVEALQIDKGAPLLPRRGQHHAVISRDWGLPAEKALA